MKAPEKANEEAAQQALDSCFARIESLQNTLSGLDNPTGINYLALGGLNQLERAAELLREAHLVLGNLERRANL